MEYRKIAWDYLTEKGAQTRITTDWKKTKVVDANELSYERKWKNTVAVTFNTLDDALLGPIIVFVDTKTKSVTQIASRE